MLKDLPSNDRAKSFLLNELKLNRKSGTYLFYGKPGSDPLTFALAFSKAMLCEVQKLDFCDKCHTCSSINSKNFADLEIIEDEKGIKIEKIRQIIENASKTSYEGGKKIFILKGVENLKKESANALLKVIEEPLDGTFFILLSKSLNIIPTILSRSTIIEIEGLSYEELGVDEKTYDFFMQNVEDIQMYLKKSGNLNIKISYKDCSKHIEKYLETNEIQDKINIYIALNDFIKNKNLISDLAKVKFSDSITKVIGKERMFLQNILNYLILKSKNITKIEKLLTYKNFMGNRINGNINIGLLMLILEL